jgi:hypothetical protein
MPLPPDPTDLNLEANGQALYVLANKLVTGHPWTDRQCDEAAVLVGQAIAGSHARRWRLDSVAEDRRVDAEAEARGE